MLKCLTIVEDIDFDRCRIGLDVEAQRRLNLGPKRREEADRALLRRLRLVGEDDERARPRLMLGRDERLAAIADRGAPCHEGEEEGDGEGCSRC